MTIIYSDGATLGHNGKLGTVSEVGIAVYIPSLDIKVYRKERGISNNEAEFKALILAIETAIEEGIKDAIFKSDSIIIVRRANGSRPTKKKDINLRMDAFQDRVFELKKSFNNIEFEWIPREENSVADYYSKLALYPGTPFTP